MSGPPKEGKPAGVDRLAQSLDQERAELVLAVSGNPVNYEMAWQIIHRWDALVEIAKAARALMDSYGNPADDSYASAGTFTAGGDYLSRSRCKTLRAELARLDSGATGGGRVTLYKWLDGTQSTHGGTGRWQKGRWRSVKGELVPCENGLHLCREQDIVVWIAPTLWLAEHDGELFEGMDKVVVRRARVVERLDGWNERTSRLFAADCAERVLPIFETWCPGDDRPRAAIAAARAFASGEIGRDELAAASVAATPAVWDSAWAAARDSARAATRAAAWDSARAAARAAAWAAVRDAARDSTWTAAMDTTFAAERKWQTHRLLDYAHGLIPANGGATEGDA